MADLMTNAPSMARHVLRGRLEALSAAEGALGFALPREACRSASLNGTHALWLGPDEWLLLSAPEAGLGDRLEAAMGAHPHSLVEVSDRQIGLVVGGPEAEAVLSVGCPLDLDQAAFPVGMCTRTVLSKAEIVLWRTGPETFHLEVWRSFGAYLRAFLTASAVVPVAD
ncbi:MAG: sarcosine oxidase subunit gamma family protein [Pseudomonadota bacterium]|jgi:sarcosine oxidase subunit gamma